MLLASLEGNEGQVIFYLQSAIQTAEDAVNDSIVTFQSQESVCMALFDTCLIGDTCKQKPAFVNSRS